MITMFPSKNMVDYTTEMNRLFSRTENVPDMLQPSFNSSITNQSSSSTDSTSPESFPEISTFQPNFSPLLPNAPRSIYEPMYETRQYDTPRASETNYMVRRPIVGRKIFSPTENSTPNHERVRTPSNSPEEMEYSNAVQNERTFQRSPSSYMIEHKIYYELFPSESKTLEMNAQVKTSPTTSNVSTVSLSSMNSSPVGPLSLYPRSPTPAPNLWPSTSKVNNELGQYKMCTFCKKNGETPIVYMTHCVKERVGGQFTVSCPILRSHVCSICSASGDEAHTISYCPVLRSNNNGQPLRSTTITLKNTRVKSNGRRRF